MDLRVLKLCVSLQHVSDFFVTSANAALSKSDEPEKVKTLLLPSGELTSARWTIDVSKLASSAASLQCTLTCTYIRTQCDISAHCCMSLSGAPVLMIAMNVL